MNRITHLLSGLALIATVMVVGHRGTDHPPTSRVAAVSKENASIRDQSSERAPVAVCFAPGTSEDYVREWQQRIWGGIHNPLDYNIGGRWEHTATDGNTGAQGTPIHLTYSFVPDGVSIEGNPSRLFARMNQLFGSPQVWQAKFAAVFERWSEVCGISYTQVSDDGASFGYQSPGVLGVRGDVRIGSINIDGPSGVLAYNYFPDGGDMVLDASEDWAAPSGNFIFLRNVVAHEHGHGWGLMHVCPVNNTKLLEPYYSSAFDGPQHDDVRAAQRNYGDAYEPNNSAATAVRLGTLTSDFVWREVGLHNAADVDFWRFAIAAGKSVTITLQPEGYPYLDGEQNGDGSCQAGSMINSSDDRNLDLTLYNWNGTVQRAQSNSRPAGQAEQIFRYTVPSAGDSFVVRVNADPASLIQLYRVVFDVYNTADPYLSQETLDFGNTPMGTPVSLSIRVTNPVSVPRLLTSIVTSGAFVAAPLAPQTIPANGYLDISVTYLATELGLQTGLLTIAHDGPGESLTCSLSGTATQSWLRFVSTNSVDFGEVPIGTTDSLRVPIRAEGNVPVVIQTLETQPPFSITLPLPYTINPYQVLMLRPRFRPTELGTVTGMLVIHHSGLGTPDTVFLRGTGVVLSVDHFRPGLPDEFRLEQNYPNPFNPTTRIGFDVPRSGNVALRVYDLQGRLVCTLVEGALVAGHYESEFDGAHLPSGVYLYRLTAPGFSGMGKMMLLK